MPFFPFIFSYLIGRRLLKVFIPQHNDLFYHFVYFGTGAGLSSLFVFLSLILCHQYQPLVIVFGHIFLLLMLYCIPVRSEGTIGSDRARAVLRPVYFLFMMGLFLSLVLPVILIKPFGDWDAWALWNFRANFICRSGELWHHIFLFNLHGHHPWLLPFYIVYGWAFTLAENPLVPLLTAIFFSWCTLGVLVYGFCERKEPRKAILSGVFLCSIPFFTQHAVSQYADIEVAYYLLAALVLVSQPVENCIRRYFLAGFMLGCASFTKDEGLVLSLLFLIFQFFYVPKRSWQALGAGFLTVMPALITVKSWMIGDPAGINKIYLPHLLDLSRWCFVFNFFVRHLFLSWWWGGTWFLLILMMWINKNGLKGALRAAFYSVGVFLFIFMALYVVVFNNLPWRLEVSVDRLFFQITPLLTYTAFSCL